MVEKITPNDKGLAFYKVYTDCLKQQAAILLTHRGVAIVAPNETDIEAKRDEQVRDEISNIGPTVPKSRLVQILGEPISSGSDQNMQEAGLTAEFYQYKHMLFIADYSKAGKRVALVMSTRDPIQGSAMFVEQLRDVTLGSAAEECNGIETTAHDNAKTGICPPSHATDYIKKVFFFQNTLLTGTGKDDAKTCVDAGFGEKGFEAKRCPGIASAPAFGVALASDNSVDDVDFEAGVNAWLNEIDFGGTFSWRSSAENDAMDARNKAEEKMTPSQLDEIDRSERAERARRTRSPITPSI